MQKSQDGLLRSLLYQILARNPDLIPLICIERWQRRILLERFRTLDIPFRNLERTELFGAFRRLGEISLDGGHPKICIFIDGLDEYEGDHSELITTLQTISQSPFIKICAASRPWQNFRDAFDLSPWKLHVEDLTKEDIKRYVRDTLEHNTQYCKLKKQDPTGAKLLVSSIQKRAQGVFLWVILVIRSLLRGLINSDTMTHLQGRLDELPTELEDYYQQILDRIEPRYAKQTSHTLQVLLGAGTALPIAIFHFTDKEIENTDYILNEEVNSISFDMIPELIDTKKRQLQARCSDLLHFWAEDSGLNFLSGLPDRVSFLHRTVFDFLRTGNVYANIISHSTNFSDPHFSLTQGYAALIKTGTVANNSLVEWFPYRHCLEFIMGHASRIKDESANSLVKTLEDLETSISILVNEKGPKLWDKLIPGCKAQNFLDFAIRCGNYQYVGAKTNRTQTLDLEYVLNLALQMEFVLCAYTMITELYPMECMNPGMVRHLLECGANPNDWSRISITQSSTDETEPVLKTIWEEFLIKMAHWGLEVDTEQDDDTEQNEDIEQNGGTQQEDDTHLSSYERAELGKLVPAPPPPPISLSHFFECCQLMIERGAERHVVALGHTPEELFEGIFHMEQFKALTELFDKLEEKARNQSPGSNVPGRAKCVLM